MRLHSLVVTAFGPFAGTERVDFDALSTAGLFLFTGATGAGKTSILDAVCFGLYGQVPGARQQSRTLRSDHAADGIRPEVVLEVTLRERRLRITRSPAWDRPKRRGSGTTVENARVLVEEHAENGWDALTTRLDEAGQLLGGLLGLSLAQFCQVVLLPQGQFAEFLRADADRRRELLESLFDTTRFAAVEAWLVNRRQASARALDELDERVGQVVARVAEAAAAEVPDEMTPDGAAAWVDRLRGEAARDRRLARQAEGAASRAADAAQAEVAEAERLAGRHERRRALTARLAELTAGQAARDAAVAELEAARRVAPLVPLVAEAARLQTRLEQARAQAVTAHGALAGQVELLAGTGTDGPVAMGLPPASAVVDAARSTLTSAVEVRGLAEQERQAAELARSTDELQRRAVELEALAAEAASWLAAAESRRARLAAARDAARIAAGSLPDAEANRDRAASRVEAATRRDALAERLPAATDLLRRRTDAHQQARDELQDARERRLAGMAAELAAALTGAQPCPVCGSPEHPDPAQPAGLRVTEADEARAAQRAAVAEAQRHDATAAVAALEADLAAARAAAGGDAPLPALRAELGRLCEEAERAGDLAATLPSAEQALATFDQEREGWLRRQVGLDEETRGLASRVAEQRDRVAATLTVLAAARGDDPSVAARAERLDALAGDLDQLADQLAEVERLGVAAADALDRAEAAAREKAVESVLTVAELARDDARLAALEDTRRRHDAELASVTEQLAEPELAALGAPPPALDPLRSAAAAAAERRDEAVTAVAAATSRVTALERLHATLAGVLAEREPVASAHRLVDQLSRLAEGKSADNRLRMSLSGYVLAARLELVAASASARLLRMSSGRYTLLHSARGGSGRSRGGLALRVLDAWTGQERDPATLSGGESFSASLALALGLADVVTAEAGGALLETLFVDEGFGTLDDDTLDEVMSVLDELRDGGRTVGVVSHVSDLRQRIPVQLRVEKGRRGSLVRQ